MRTDLNKSIVLSSLFWKLMERGGTQGIQFVVSIVIARLLSPEDYGIIALVLIFINLASVFVQSGFSTALIQKRDADNLDFSSVFYASMFVAGVIYLVLFITSPLIFRFYGNLHLVSVLRILSIILFLGVFNSIQNAYIARNMAFKKLFFSSSGAILISGVIGILAAYMGYGVWALVAQQLASQLSITIILWFTVRWRPTLAFSMIRIKELFSYSSKLLASEFINRLYMDIRTLIIGRIYSPDILGFYNRGEQFPKLIVTNINGSIQSVMLPTLVSQQDNRKRVKDMVRRSIVTSSFIMFPMMVGLAVIAEPIVKIILTEKWLPSVPFLQIFCASYALWPIHTANLQAINALGRSDIFLNLEIIKKVIGLAILGVTVFYGVFAIALGGVLVGIICSFINAYPNKKLLDYGYIEQWKDITPSIILSVIMGLAVYIINIFDLVPWITLIVQIAVGAILYFGMAYVFKLEIFIYLLNTIKEIIKKKSGTLEIGG